MRIAKEATAFPCPNCGTNVPVPINYTGGTFVCPKCHTTTCVKREEK